MEVLFTGWDHGIDLGVEHAFERSLPIAEAMSDDVMLAWEANGQPLLPQHGFPLRLVVPSWYGMASVKWLRAITVLNEPFRGVEQEQVYRYQVRKGETGEPVRHKRVNSAIMPPGIPDLLTRHRFVAPGHHVLQGMAWSGAGRITKVEVSTDGGTSWREAQLVPVSADRFAWTQWRAPWDATSPGRHILACRAYDEAGSVQPMNPNTYWNRQAMGGNGVQRISVTVQEGVDSSAARAPSQARMAIAGARVPPELRTENQLASR
jgi:DMSO/TMAO reductase YedYZ molybdopterin-dependent catalytic subunit